MEEQQRGRRITPRRLSFNLNDFIGIPDDGGRHTGIPETTREVRPELDLLNNLETPANAAGRGPEETPVVITAYVLNSILTGQQNLVNMVTNLSSLVNSQRTSGDKALIVNTENAADDAPVTRRELRQLLQDKCSPPSTIFDLEPPLAEFVVTTPYPQGYQPPAFRKFDGTGSATEHVRSFLDDLGIYRSNRNLRLKEFSKSLAGRAFTWYAKLKSYSIKTREELVTEFCGKFLEEERALHIMDLGRIKQKAGEGLVTFIKRYRDRALQCKETLPEADLVYGCIKNIEDGSQIFLSLSSVSTFAELMRKAADVAKAMKRKIFHKQVKLVKVLLPEADQDEGLHRKPLPNHSVNTIVLSSNMIRVEEVEEEYNEERALAVGLAKTRGFRMLFGQLGMEENAQREAAEAIIHIARKWGGQLGAINAPLTRLAQSHVTAIVFREPAHLSPQFCHNCPLYVEATIEGVKVRRALVDNGSGVNIIPTYLFHKLNMPNGRIRKSDITLSTFHGEAVESLGRVHAVLEVGPIKTVNVFQVVEGDSSYQLLLGRPWIHLHHCVPSTLHQCIKLNFRGKEIEIPGVKAPFESSEFHLMDATLFDDVAPPGSILLKTEQGVLLREDDDRVGRHHVSRPNQAFKRPKAKGHTEIKKEYLPNGEMALDMKVRRLRVWGDSNLVIKQLRGEYGVKEASLAMYRDEALRLIDLFEEIHMAHIPRAANRYADALATIGSKVKNEERRDVVTFRKVGKPSLSIISRVEEPSDWRTPILSQFKQRVFTKGIKDYYELKGELYKKSLEVLLMRCVTEREGGKKLECLHQAMCGQEGPSLYRRMQRIGMYWPSMKVHWEEVQRACPCCREGREALEVNTVEDDWRYALKEYLSFRILPDTPFEAKKLRKKVERYFIQEEELFKESLTGDVLKCLGRKEERSKVTELIEGLRDKAGEEMLQHHRRLTLTYEKMVRPRMFQEGELVLKATDAVMRKQHVSKWAPNWEGPYIVVEARDNGYCTLLDPEDQRVLGPINLNLVRKTWEGFKAFAFPESALVATKCTLALCVKPGKDLRHLPSLRAHL
ncbi:Ribonuclease H-like superfamily [Sesbania bispinosa]|nr:Ribonuclease H-like superfamily [Sesbania bispinosa]